MKRCEDRCERRVMNVVDAPRKIQPKMAGAPIRARRVREKVGFRIWRHFGFGARALMVVVDERWMNEMGNKFPLELASGSFRRAVRKNDLRFQISYAHGPLAID